MAALSLAQKAKMAVSFIWPIVSIVLAAITYAEWAGSLDYFSGIVNNWESGPVVEIDFRSSCAGSSEPYPFADLDDRRSLRWSLEYCDCTDDSREKRVIEEKCSGTRDPRVSNCTRAIISQTPIPLPAWRAGMKVCLRRLPLEYAATKRKIECVAGEARCADGTCFPQGFCPITDIRHLNDPSALPAGFELRNVSNVYFGFKRASATSEVASDKPDLLRGLVDVRQSDAGDSPTDGNWQRLDQVSLLSLLQGNKMPDSANTVYQHLQSKQWDGLDTASTTPWFLSTRAEIKWDDALCGSKQDFVNTAGPINNVNRANLALLVITIISSIVSLLGAYMIYKDLTDDDPSNDLHNATRFEKISVAFGVVDLLPTAVVTYYGFRYRSYFEKIANDACTDAVTAANIEVLTKNLRAVGSIMVVKTIGSTLYLFYRIFRIMRPLPPPKKREDFDKIKNETNANNAGPSVAVVSVAPSAPEPEPSLSTIALQPLNTAMSPVPQQQMMMQQPMMQQPMMQQPMGMQQQPMMQPMGMNPNMNMNMNANMGMDQQQLAMQQQQMLMQQQQMAQMQMQGQMPMNNNMGMQQM